MEPKWPVKRKQPRFLNQRSLGRGPWPGPSSGIFWSSVSQSSKWYNLKGEVLGIPEFVAKLGRSVGELGTQELAYEVPTESCGTGIRPVRLTLLLGWLVSELS